MVLPAEILAIKLLFWALGIYLIAISNRRARKLRAEDMVQTSLGPPQLLLVYRLLMLAWGLFIGIRQLAEKGSRTLAFYTVWNWHLLTLFFALASLASLRAWRQGYRRPQQQKDLQHGMDFVSTATLATFCVVTPMTGLIDGMTWLVLVPMLIANSRDASEAAFWHTVHHNFESYMMVLAVDALTWLLLVPMLGQNKDLDWTCRWHARMYSAESYQQHGFNAVMILGELLLNRIPVDLYSSGWLAVWSSLFGLWSAIFYVRNGRFIYPFLDAYRPYAWASYLGLSAVHCLAYLSVMGLSRLKERFLLKEFPHAGKGHGHIVGARGSFRVHQHRQNRRQQQHDTSLETVTTFTTVAASRCIASR